MIFAASATKAELVNSFVNAKEGKIIHLIHDKWAPTTTHTNSLQ